MYSPSWKNVWTYYSEISVKSHLGVGYLQLHPGALYLLGIVYLTGDCVKQDMDSAIWCFHRASEKVINFISSEITLRNFVCRLVFKKSRLLLQNDETCIFKTFCKYQRASVESISTSSCSFHSLTHICSGTCQCCYSIWISFTERLVILFQNIPILLLLHQILIIQSWFVLATPSFLYRRNTTTSFHFLLSSLFA